MEESAQVFEGSKGSISSNVSELFDPPPVQVSIKNSQWCEFEPVQNIDNNQPTMFVVNSGENFIDFSQTYLYCKMKLQYADKTKLEDGCNVASVNCPLFSQFTSHKIYNGNEEISSIELFNYNQLVLQQLNNSREAKQTTLAMAGFFEEETPTAHDTENSTVFKKLKRMFKGSAEREFMGKLSGNMYDMKRLYAPGQTLRFEFFPTSDKFFILDYGANASTREITRVVTDIRLVMRHVTLMPSLSLAIAQQARMKPYIYPFNRVIQRTLYINEGATSSPFNFISNGYVPSRCIVGLVNRMAYTGTLESNPYSFKNHGITHCYLRAGSALYPADSLKRRPYDFAKGHYVHAYKSLIDCMNLDAENGLGQLSYKSFGTNNCLFAFDLTSNMCAGDMQIWKSQNLQLYLEFGSPVPQMGIQAIVFLELQSILTLDSVNGSVNIDPPGI